MKHYSYTDTAKEIRNTLKVAFPQTKFSVRSKSYSGGSSITAFWTDGPTSKQVDAILDRFEGKGFDGMTDCSYYCGRRTYKGEQVDFSGSYCFSSRELSRETVAIVADRVAYETGLGKLPLDQYGNVSNGNTPVPFAWHAHWIDGDSKYLTLADIEGSKYLLAHDSHSTDYVSHLVSKISCALSFEEAQPVELPQYIDVKATVETGRADFEEPRAMFHGHAVIDEIN
jgi:hypothetical protein